MAAVLEAVSTAINAELGPKGIVAFPTHAPRLVELDVTEIRPSSTTRYVNEFVLEHESSAIGLAGSRARASPSPEVRFARELLRDLRWEFERSTTGKGTVKVLSFFEGGAERGYKYKNRAMTRADLVGAIRELLRTFAAQPNRERMVVCVDELKDLFHIQKVHFVVAVSTDALDSFAQRGLAGRDAFDSMCSRPGPPASRRSWRRFATPGPETHAS